MQKIVYTSPYIPAEWIAAHGLSPSRIIPSASVSNSAPGQRQGLCPFAGTLIAHVLAEYSNCPVIMTTECDQMRRAFDVITQQRQTPAFLFNLPSTWQGSSAKKLYTAELRRLSRWLCSFSANMFSNDVLAETMLQYNNKRGSILAAKNSLTPRQFSEAIATFNNSPDEFSLTNIPSHKTDANGAPLAILGGPLLGHDFEIFDIVENCGGHITLDATETGQRTMPDTFNADKTETDLLAELTRAYFDHIPEIWQRPNVRLYEWLRTNIEQYNIRGIIFRRFLFCDLWHGELHRIREFTKLPVLDIDVSPPATAIDERTKYRIQAFMETLQ